MSIHRLDTDKAIVLCFKVAAHVISEVHGYPLLANGQALVVSSCVWHWKAISPGYMKNTTVVRSTIEHDESSACF